MKIKKMFALAAAALLCATSSPAAASTNITALVRGNTDFALSLYGQLSTNAGNFFFSPCSISTCLGMVYDGARGETARQMAQALDFSTNQDQMGADFGALQTELDSLQGDAGLQFTLANGLWAQQNFPFLPDFLGNATSNYQAVVNQVNFATESEPVREEINQWVAQQTQNIIQNLLVPGTVNPDTRLVLVNAIYFKGAWASAFNSNVTTIQPFYTSGTPIQSVPINFTPNQTANTPLTNQTLNFSPGHVSLMYQTEPVGYYQADSFQAVELPYSGTNATMVVLLPADYGGLAQLEASLTPQALAQVLTNLAVQTVDVFLPKFSLQWSAKLNSTLEDLGMTDAFLPGLADFSGMDGTNDLSIDFVVHKAFVDVDETGTVAAAATGVGIATATGVALPFPPTPVFRADHPFIFLIRETRTGSILFMGRVSDPTAPGVGAPVLISGPIRVPNNPVFLAASYGGLFYDTNGMAVQSSGALSLSVAVTGKYTGNLDLAGQSYAFAGQFTPQGSQIYQNVTIQRHHLSNLVLTLQAPDSDGMITGTLSDGTWSAEVTCEQTSLGYSANHPAPQAGSYSLTLLGSSDGTLSPGYGSYARVAVAPNGMASLAGQLSDGASISQTSAISTNGFWPLYVPLYAGKGSLLGWINFTNLPASRLNGTASWIKTGAFGPDYAHGFTNLVTVLGSIVHP
jgi:serpin B